LFWVSHGKSNAQIAQILGISPATVSKHIEHIYPAVARSRTAAASFSSCDASL
jgi:DNA-binding NarL/FixJ family response regulator